MSAGTPPAADSAGTGEPPIALAATEFLATAPSQPRAGA
jgi:hypothetical protein